ncbi:MAG: STAS/SEC14 domain-containing protein [Ideonella sp.]
MIELIPDLPDNVVGIGASGQVSADDYETVLVPAVESRLERNDKLRLLYRLGPDFKGFTTAAMWDDLKLGAAHWKAWERIAVVTDVEWIGNTARAFGFAMPCPVRIFPLSAIAQATDWLCKPVR